ncbi:glycoprotein [Blanchseco virus]|uniref:Glycoprotein n=1 Tax=Blanchseco virus TaxID=2704630 RepID=A0A5B8GPD9_9RHAB|nr:glycoprotein [Blanchseco virus]QDW81032.1 glycoprotein [Blanchseco virus]
MFLLFLLLFVVHPLVGTGLPENTTWDFPNHVYFFPRDELYTWKPIRSSELSCPPFFPITTGSGKISVTYATPGPMTTESATITGYSCYKSIFSVKCSENFVGWQTISHTIRPTEVSHRECLDEYRRIKTGSLPAAHEFPAPNCGWWADRWAEKEYITLIHHPVSFDPYSLEFFDPLFPGGKCNNRVCSLIHQGGIWIQTEEHVGICENWHSGIGHVGLVKNELVLFPMIGEVRSLQGACTLKFCGHIGYRLATGEFFKLDFYSLPKRIPFCEKGVQVRLDSPRGMTYEIEEKVMKEEDRLECLTSVALMQSTGHASQYLLSTLVPRHAGPGDAYRLSNGIIEHAHVFYVGITKASTGRDQNVVGIDSKGNPVQWTDWIKDNGTLIGPNGVTRKPGSPVVIPRFERLANEYDLSLARVQSLKPIPHPLVTFLANKSDFLESESDNLGRDGSFWEGVRDWFHSMWGSFTWSMILVVLGIVGLVFLLRRYSVKLRLPDSPKVEKKKKKSRRGNPVRDPWGDIADTAV